MTEANSRAFMHSHPNYSLKFFSTNYCIASYILLFCFDRKWDLQWKEISILKLSMVTSFLAWKPQLFVNSPSTIKMPLWTGQIYYQVAKL